MAIITNTYTDDDKCDTYLALSLFDATTIDAKIAAQAINARDKIDAFLGRKSNFSVAQLAETQFAGIVDAASQLTACLVQNNAQSAAMNFTEDAITDCKEAFLTLKNWALKNGIETPDMVNTKKHIQTEIVYITNDPDAVI